MSLDLNTVSASPGKGMEGKKIIGFLCKPFGKKKEEITFGYISSLYYENKSEEKKPELAFS